MKKIKTLSLCLIIGLVLNGCTNNTILSDSDLFVQNTESTDTAESLIEDTSSTVAPYQICSNDAIIDSLIFNPPAYADEPYVEINGNVPLFASEEITTTAYENYSPLDDLDRPQTAMACLGIETMPSADEQRGEIGMVKPAGWHTVKYPGIISDLYLYNRCHLIGWQLGAENANTQNLITGTRYLNVEGMLPFENQIANYIEDTANHVIYRVTPIYVQNELLCRGVLMEAQSVETNDIEFCVYCFNVQPGIVIDYMTGDSWEDQENLSSETVSDISEDTKLKSYVLNTNTMKIHVPDCPSVKQIADHNRQDYMGTIDDLLSQGYSPCGYCHPE